jgi:putative DNA primase/helicase
MESEKEFTLNTAEQEQRAVDEWYSRLQPDEFFEKNTFVPTKLSDALLAHFKCKTLMGAHTVYVYKDGYYQRTGEEVLINEAKKLLGEKAKTYYINEALFMVKASTFTEPSNVCEDLNLINVKNGLYNITTKQLEPHTPDKFITYQIPVELNPAADCPEIKRFIAEIVIPDDVKIIQELTGYCLYREYFIHKAFMLVGDGANGKSTLIGLLENFLGHENISSISLQDLDSSPFAAHTLYGKLANMHHDLPARALNHTGMFKSLTGNDVISADVKFRPSPLMFTNYAKMIFAMNKVPISKDVTSAFFRRLIFINFPNKFEGDKMDPNKLKKISTPEEMSGFLNWALEGLLRIIEQGAFSYSATTDEIHDKYERLSSPITAFIKDHVVSSSQDYITKEDLYSNFVEYCQSNKLPTVINSAFSKELLANISNVRTERVTHNGQRKMAWRGIRFATVSDLSDETDEEKKPDKPDKKPEKISDYVSEKLDKIELDMSKVAGVSKENATLCLKWKSLDIVDNTHTNTRQNDIYPHGDYIEPTLDMLATPDTKNENKSDKNENVQDVKVECNKIIAECMDTLDIQQEKQNPINLTQSDNINPINAAVTDNQNPVYLTGNLTEILQIWRTKYHALSAEDIIRLLKIPEKQIEKLLESGIIFEETPGKYVPV